MKRRICLLLALLLLLSALAPAMAETLPTQPPRPTVRTDNLITAPPDAVLPGAGMQISPLDGGDAARVLGVESEPVSRPVSEFLGEFIQFSKENFDAEPTFAGPYYSDGGWVYVSMCKGVCVLARAVSDEKDAPLERVTVTGEKDGETGALFLTAAALHAAARCGSMGRQTIKLMLFEPSPETYFEESCDLWLENGYQLSTGRGEFGFPIGKIEYKGELSGRKTFAPWNEEKLAPIENGPSVETFMARIEKACVPFGLTPPEFPAEYEEHKDEDENLRMYVFSWDDCAVVAATDAAGDAIRHVAAVSFTGDTNSLWARTIILFFAASGAEQPVWYDLSLLSGSTGGWDTLSDMMPYAVYNGVMLQCTDDEEYLTASIDGAAEE